MLEKNLEENKDINIFFDDNGDDLQNIIDNLLLEIYKRKVANNCNDEIFEV